MFSRISIFRMFSVLLALALMLAQAPPALAAPGDTTLVSVGYGGEQANNYSFFFSVSTSADGHYVAFDSYASNLVAGDTNGYLDVFVRNTWTGTTTLVSVGLSGAQANYPSTHPSISANGRYVAFESNASNLVAGGTNGNRHIYVRDIVEGTTTLVSVGLSGEQANSHSDHPSISSDGRYVAFESIANNLVAGDTSYMRNIFVRDTAGAGSTKLVSVDLSGGPQVNAESYSPSISSDGRVAFESYATNIVAGDTNGASDIFVRDTVANTTTVVSVGLSGAQAESPSNNPSISDDGHYVAFQSNASNLVVGDTNGARDIFVRNTGTNTTTLISINSSGAQANNSSDSPSISSDGRYVAFASAASNLVSGDTNGYFDVFVRDTQTNVNTLASVDSSGAQANGYAGHSEPTISISADGRYVAFPSPATNLVVNDTNGFEDIFMHENDFTPPNPVPAITLLGPNSAAKGGPDFTLTITGTNFVDTSIVQWNGATRPRAFVSSTTLTATITAADIANAGVAYITVFNPAPGGGTSNPQAFFINNTGAQITSSNTVSGTNPSATTGGSTGITANATGGGTVTVGIYNSNPGGTPSFSSSDAYMDVHVAPGNTFTSLTIVDCNLNGGTQVYWWNGTTWALASNQSYNSSTLCVTITVNNSTSPSLSQLTGTPFGAAADVFKLFLPLILR